MSVQKSEALVLKTIPFRETSLILHLFTKEHGLVHAIAKGARASKKGQTTIERGQLLELNLYIKPDRDLQTAGAINISEYFANTREDLIKSSLRDCAFEVIMSIIKDSHEHPEQFDFFKKFVTYLNNSKPEECYPASLWLFLYRFSEHLGISFNLENCITCGCMLLGSSTLNISNGGLECDSCRKVSSSNHIPLEVLSFLKTGKPTPSEIGNMITKSEAERISITLANFIRYHFDIKYPFKTFEFLFTIL